ncbi:unnamed protein product [Bursaphelenchus xylophilus]|uniref:(pine wood nematode) hypothetical protein n=1 Tax=Bursaphelenchus xylophilus TaxID=6326 RepID=A0A1I7SDG8_BURXY|nr:unnamed protein product [Bursaphelenchus xylophilus]CAG9131686.1 unnamed protein product [Bursaphelenchus xylophilus]
MDRISFRRRFQYLQYRYNRKTILVGVAVAVLVILVIIGLTLGLVFGLQRSSKKDDPPPATKQTKLLTVFPVGERDKTARKKRDANYIFTEDDQSEVETVLLKALERLNGSFADQQLIVELVPYSETVIKNELALLETLESVKNKIQSVYKKKFVIRNEPSQNTAVSFIQTNRSDTNSDDSRMLLFAPPAALYSTLDKLRDDRQAVGKQLKNVKQLVLVSTDKDPKMKEEYGLSDSDATVIEDAANNIDKIVEKIDPKRPFFPPATTPSEEIETTTSPPESAELVDDEVVRIKRYAKLPEATKHSNSEKEVLIEDYDSNSKLRR